MIFNSYLFILLFLPVTILGYYICRSYGFIKLAKVFLVGMSLLFYGYFKPIYLVLLLGSIVVNYALYLQLRCKHTKVILGIGIILNLGAIFYFKYFDFFLASCNYLFKTNYRLLSILLPLGISFFTFQQISFLIDAYKGEIEECSFVDYALFVTFFPQLVAGPIVTHREMLPQFAQIGTSEFSLERVQSGIYLFVVGLAKKVLLADIFVNAVSIGFDRVQTLNSSEVILVMVAYSIQLYFDFSGYCDMARGLARMLQFELPTNFASPYQAADITEFWQRWHITLTRFLTRYLYIPLGGNRKGMVRTYCNTFIVFLVSGVWHGAGIIFVLWGVLHGIAVVLTKVCSPILKYIPKTIKVMCTFTFVTSAFSIFRCTSLTQAIDLWKQLGICNWGGIRKEITQCFNIDEIWYLIKIADLEAMPYSKSYAMIGFFVVACILIWGCKNTNIMCEQVSAKKIYAIMLGILFVWAVLSLDGVSTFLYFNF